MSAAARESITCVVADDHPPILDSLSRFLAGAGFQIVGTAPDGETALATVEATRPTVLLADVRMPRMDGIALAREVVEKYPETAVLVYSGAGDTALANDALDAGARGFALKDAPLADLARAVDIVAGGGLYVDPVLAARIASPASPRRKDLTERERDVLRMLAEGSTYADIGAQLHLSPDTIRAHAQRAMTKLGARTRTHAVAIALREGVIS